MAGVEWFPFDYERSNFIFISSVSEVTCKHTDGSEVSEGGHDEISPAYRKALRSRHVA